MKACTIHTRHSYHNVVTACDKALPALLLLVTNARVQGLGYKAIVIVHALLRVISLCLVWAGIHRPTNQVNLTVIVAELVLSLSKLSCWPQ